MQRLLHGGLCMKIYDLTAEIKEGIWDYGTPYVSFEKEHIASLNENGYIANKYIITGHLGTHLECMAHWKEDINGIGEEKLCKFFGNARVLKVLAEGQEIKLSELISAGADRLQKDEICILVTGWEKHFGMDDYIIRSPYLSLEAAEYLAQKEIKLIAMDTPMIGSIEDGIEKIVEGAQLADMYFLDNGINILLGLVNCLELPENVDFYAFPLKINGAEGSPVRAVAMER